MHFSSENIGTIAAALAQAQGELTNPEKSLVATIQPAYPRDSQRTFRYAPLSSGLDIVRKILGKHEIATVQTTSIDKESGLVRLTTVMAHSSGQWISSEWPVCPISDTSSPQRMGAALTYARRYALFTLVGIAGEDDLDAPDVEIGTSSEKSGPTVANKQSVQFIPCLPIDRSRGDSRKPVPLPAARPILEPAASVQLRQQLMTELQALASAEEALGWARRSLPAKNTLTTDDAHIIEAAFQTKISAFPYEIPEPSIVNDHPGATRPAVDTSAETNRITTVQAAVLADGAPKPLCPITKPRRIRHKRHLQYVSAQACLVCGRQPTDAHHLRFAQPRAMGRKSSDEFTVPLCRIHHRQLHQAGNEIAWWKGFGIKPIEVAERLWAKTVAARLA
jgi:hypothetical protein